MVQSWKGHGPVRRGPGIRPLLLVLASVLPVVGGCLGEHGSQPASAITELPTHVDGPNNPNTGGLLEVEEDGHEQVHMVMPPRTVSVQQGDISMPQAQDFHPN